MAHTDYPERKSNVSAVGRSVEDGMSGKCFLLTRVAVIDAQAEQTCAKRLHRAIATSCVGGKHLGKNVS